MNLTWPATHLTLEELREAFKLDIPQAAKIIDKFGGEKVRIDRFMSRCVRRRA